VFFSQLICLQDGWSPRKGLSATRFPGRFLNKPLNDSTIVWNLGQESGWNFEVIQFFIGANTPPKCVAYGWTETVSKLSVEDFDRAIGSLLGRAGKFDSLRAKVVWLQGSPRDKAIEASMFLRGSASLTEAGFKSINSLAYAADGKGFAVIDDSYDVQERAYRLNHLICLACAYQQTLSQATEILADATVKRSLAESTLRDWSVFLARFYSDEPVRSTTVELVHFYGAYRDRLRIGKQSEELTAQLRLLADLVTSDRRESSQKQIESLQRKINFLGLLLTFFALIIGGFSALQIQPKNAQEFRENWSRCLKVSVAFCLEGGGESKDEDLSKRFSSPPLKHKNPPPTKSNKESK
jgi:hypothetical protein